MSHFFAYLSRLKQIQRWGLMRNTRTENDMEHTTQVAWIAHVLSVFYNEAHPEQPLDPGEVALLALYHDVSEVITGDLATPIKYFNPEIKNAFHQIEAIASSKLVEMLPEPLREAFAPYLLPDNGSPAFALVRAADKIAAYLKCLEEQKAGNHEFDRACESIRKGLDALQSPEVERFFALFVESFSLTLDELN